MLLYHYPLPRLATPAQKIMMTADTHVNRLYITLLLRICWYTSVHVEYLPYHLPLFRMSYFWKWEIIRFYSNKEIKPFSACSITLMGWKRTAKIYVFFETQSKYGNKYWKLCIKMNLTKDNSTSRSWLSKYFSQLKVIAVFTLTLSHLRSIPLFIVVTTCEGKCGSRVRVTFYPHYRHVNASTNRHLRRGVIIWYTEH